MGSQRVGHDCVSEEQNQKEKNKCHILIPIYQMQKDDTDKPIYRAAMEIQTQRTDLCGVWLGRREGKNGELAWKHIR